MILSKHALQSLESKLQEGLCIDITALGHVQRRKIVDAEERLGVAGGKL